jgi:hypothetical protein
MMAWFKRLLMPSPIHGEAGKVRGYNNTCETVRKGMTTAEANLWWVGADPPQDDYDRGVLDALTDSGFRDPMEDIDD